MTRIHRLFLILCMWCGTAVAGPWSQVGTPVKPAWVADPVGRRLRLLSALPAMASSLESSAKAYFGSQGPGMSVGLVLKDGLFYSQGFGFGDAKKTCTPNEHTVFRAGSLSKVMTGTGLLTLLDKDITLDSEADGSRFLPELKSVCPKFNVSCARGSQHLGIKLKHLVSHTAGLANVLDQTHASVNEWLADLKKSFLLFTPGQFSAYSGVGVEGVGLIEQRLAGKSYVDFIHDNLFVPLGMTDSSMNPIGVAHAALDWQFAFTAPTWSFSPVLGPLAGDTQPMILPAGGLATSVADLSHFIRMWLTKKAPERNGHPIISVENLDAAVLPLFSSTAAPPTSCAQPPPPPPPALPPTGLTDNNGFGYSFCAIAKGFGVNWVVAPPFIEHNGDEPGTAGSNTVIDQAGGMGATGLISTEPFPSVKPQPPTLDGGFMNTVVFGLLNSGLGADAAATDWTGQALAVGVARWLFLSGKVLNATDVDMLMPSFVQSHHLDSANVLAFLTSEQAKSGPCATFRVTHVHGAHDIDVHFECHVADRNLRITVEPAAPFRISWVDVDTKSCPVDAPTTPTTPPPTKTTPTTCKPPEVECSCRGKPRFCTSISACAHVCGGNVPRR